jgi:hypothetical protein
MICPPSLLLHMFVVALKTRQTPSSSDAAAAASLVFVVSLLYVRLCGLLAVLAAAARVAWSHSQKKRFFVLVNERRGAEAIVISVLFAKNYDKDL